MLYSKKDFKIFLEKSLIMKRLSNQSPGNQWINQRNQSSGNQWINQQNSNAKSWGENGGLMEYLNEGNNIGPGIKGMKFEQNANGGLVSTYYRDSPQKTGGRRVGAAGSSMHKGDSVLTPPSFSIDPLDPKNDAAYYDYLDALDWEKADMESNRGSIYEQEAGRGPRRDITSRKAPGYHDFDGKEYMHVPKRLNSGRNFWGFTGSRAGLSPMTKRISKAHTPKHFWEQMKNFWPNKISSLIASERKKDADFWADRAEFMEDKNSDGGMVFEEVPDTLRQKGMRRGLLAGHVIAQRTHDDYTGKKLPKGLVQGNTFWGLPGGRSSRGVGTAKRMSKNSKNKHVESKWEKDVSRLSQIFDPRAFMNRDRLGVVEETNIFGIPYTGARAIGSNRSLLPFNTAPFTQFGNKNHIGSGPTRGSSAMKSMHKSISSMNQGGVKHVVGGYRGGKMSKAMDMKTHAPKMPSTKRDIRNTDKYFN